MAKLKVLLADDHPLILTGIRGALAGAGDIEIVGEASSGAQVLPLIARTSPDLVLLDLRLPELDGMLCLERIRERHRNVTVVILSVIDDPEQIHRALERGAAAYIVKSIDSLDLAAAIRQAASGKFVCLGPLATREHAHESDSELSDREVEILQQVARGLSNRAIGEELWLSEQTVKFHLHNIYRKLGVTNRTEAAGYAFEHGMAEALVHAAAP